MTRFCFLMVLVWSYGIAHGQSGSPKGYFSDSQIDLAISGSRGNSALALSWTKLHPVAFKGKFQVGYGIRLTGFVAANKYYTTAPAKYTSTVQNLGTIFSNTIQGNIDTITTATAQTNSVNIALALQYTIAPRLEAGFNIDATGFSFGQAKRFNIISSTYDAGQEPIQHGSPTVFNLLLTSDNDLGSLNSELYIRYWLRPRIGLRAGYTFLFSEYSTDRSLSFNNGEIVNGRFRYKARMVLFAVTFKPFFR